MATYEGRPPPERDARGRLLPGSPHPNPEAGMPASARSKPWQLSKLLRGRLAEPMPDDPEGRTYGEVIVANLVDRAAAADDRDAVKAITTILDRVEGKAVQKLEHDILHTKRLVQGDRLPDGREELLSDAEVDDDGRMLYVVDPTTPPVGPRGDGDPQVDPTPPGSAAPDTQAAGPDPPEP